ncbi:MAG: acetate--CoA ligase family protein [Nanoarchaeota archaeon]
MPRQLSMQESYALLARYKLPFSEPKYIYNEQDLLQVRHYPAAVKIISPDIIHKSDVGGIRIDVRNHEELKKAYFDILAAVKQNAPHAKIEGVAAFSMAQGTQLLVGMKKDPQFGDVLAFGLGGVFVEILKDISLRISPVTKRDAYEMIKDIKAYTVLEGARGGEPVNVDIIAEMLERISKMCQKEKNIVELDFNPVIANSREAKIVDVRIIVEE